MVDATPLRECSKCKVAKPLVDYYKNGSGFRPDCKSCTKAQQLAYRKANAADIERRRKPARDARKAEKAQYDKQYRLRDPEAQRARSRAYYLTNTEQHRNNGRRWRQLNAEADKAAAHARYLLQKEARLEMGRAWRADNLERARLITAESMRRRRARIAGNESGPVDLEVLWTGYCGICGAELDASVQHPDPMSKSVDHIIPIALGGPHRQDNLQWTHLVCNVSKGARLP